MQRLLIIMMLFVFSQATVCLTTMYLLDHLELITLVDTTSSGTMIEEEETDEEYSCNAREEILESVYISEVTDLSYFNEQNFYLLPGYTDRVFSPPEISMI
ncbi:MAG: hypothetical protein K1X54_00650 [Flavobacteriales bacterium]|nr:hypothetical protein [Flavobacteriales bacterium]